MKSYSNDIISREEFDNFKKTNETQSRKIEQLRIVALVNGIVTVGLTIGLVVLVLL